MKRNVKLVQWLTAIAIMSQIACQPNSKNATKDTQAGGLKGPVSKLLTTRSEKNGPLKVIVRLPAEPLSKVAKKSKAEQLTLILEQQKQFSDKLKSISSDIQIIFTYKNVLNGLYIIVPEELVTQVDAIIPNGTSVELSTSFKRPEAVVQNESNTGDLTARNSTKFIGSDQLHALGIKGQGMKVGIIDTGIDYTHSMLGGSGAADEYKSINPSKPAAQFPNSKVVGGFDFVGTEYDSASANPMTRIPKPDANPLDEGGHGSHVAGTVAGHGNGTTTYDGVAPEASLYALKVFGKEGSTDDAIVIAALDYAADPDGNPDTNDTLDVVNLSLGSPFGSPKLLYKEAIENLNEAGTVIVASAGNSGNVSYITGAPATSDDALSVAASVDDMDQNWHFSAAAFKLAEDKEVIAEMAEATFTKPLEKIEKLAGKLVYVGIAKSISEEQAALVKGNIALIDRGEITFATKLKNALDAGAIGAVVINNAEGNPFTMGGGEGAQLEIPAIMIGLDPGKSIRDQVQSGGEVIANLKNDKKISKPELIDTLTDFSSRGPRSEDSIIKPEISAPGSNIISAKMGGGSEPASMSGTSMASPHMTGVIALLKQTHPKLTPQELKSLVMLSSKSIKDAKGETYPIALQGAGRVQVKVANDVGITMVPAALSLGRSEIVSSKLVSRKIKFKNIEGKDLTLKLSGKLNKNLELISPKSLSLKADEESVVDIQIKVTAPEKDQFDHEIDGFIVITDQNNKAYTVPVLAMVLKISSVTASALTVHSSSADDASGSVADLQLTNSSPNPGLAFIFNLLGKDDPKDNQGLRNRSFSTSCDLESVGYRTVITEVDGKNVEVLQMALKLYNPLTRWNACEFSVLIDSNGDGIADQELAGANRANTEGLGNGMASLLLDANKARALRKEYDSKVAANNEASLDFSTAVQEMMGILAVEQSTFMIIQTSTASLKKVPGQNLRVKVGSLSLEQDIVEANDFLGSEWLTLPLQSQAQTLTDIPEAVMLAGKSQTKVSLTKGEGKAPIIIYYPENHASMTSAEDGQSQVLKVEYKQE